MTKKKTAPKRAANSETSRVSKAIALEKALNAHVGLITDNARLVEAMTSVVNASGRSPWVFDGMFMVAPGKRSAAKLYWGDIPVQFGGDPKDCSVSMTIEDGERYLEMLRSGCLIGPGEVKIQRGKAAYVLDPESRKIWSIYMIYLGRVVNAIGREMVFVTKLLHGSVGDEDQDQDSGPLVETMEQHIRAPSGHV
jgi:hypothetical protein